MRMLVSVCVCVYIYHTPAYFITPAGAIFKGTNIQNDKLKEKSYAFI